MLKTCASCQKTDPSQGLYTLLCCNSGRKMCKDCALFLHRIDEHCVYCNKYVVMYNPKTRFYYDSDPMHLK